MVRARKKLKRILKNFFKNGHIKPPTFPLSQKIEKRETFKEIFLELGSSNDMTLALIQRNIENFISQHFLLFAFILQNVIFVCIFILNDY